MIGRIQLDSLTFLSAVDNLANLSADWDTQSFQQHEPESEADSLDQFIAGFEDLKAAVRLYLDLLEDDIGNMRRMQSLFTQMDQDLTAGPRAI